MTSINTNIAAMAALQTLRSVNTNLFDTQNQVSTGFRVAQASDNAAYWSIATTMRSDNRALGAVFDTLGLEQANVDTAYTGMSSVVDVLAQFNAKLVAAKQDGVDKFKIQDELNQLKQQVAGIAAASSFSGINWLNTDISDIHDRLAGTSSVISSFVRDSAGGVSVKSIDVDLSKVSLFNSTGSGLLQGEPVLSMEGLGGFLGTNADASAGIPGETQYHGVTSPTAFTASDALSFDLIVDASPQSAGITYHIAIDKSTVDAALGTTDGLISDSNDFIDVLNEAFSAAGMDTAKVGYNSPTDYIIFTKETSGHPGSGVSVSNISSTLASGFAFGLNEPTIVDFNNWPGGDISFTFSQPFQISGTSSFSFDYTTADGSRQTLSIGKDDVDRVLGRGDGVIASASDMAAVLQSAAASTDVTITSAGTSITFSRDNVWGRKAAFSISNVQEKFGQYLDFNFLDIDITNGANIDHYIDGLNYMLNETTDAASVLGSLKSRIDMQSEFTSKLMDSIDSGVGRLVDADMEDESTRLQSLQTQQQLALQSLSIANSAPQNILSLFGR